MGHLDEDFSHLASEISKKESKMSSLRQVVELIYQMWKSTRSILLHEQIRVLS